MVEHLQADEKNNVTATLKNINGIINDIRKAAATDNRLTEQQQFNYVSHVTATGWKIQIFKFDCRSQ